MSLPMSPPMSPPMYEPTPLESRVLDALRQRAQRVHVAPRERFEAAVCLLRCAWDEERRLEECGELRVEIRNVWRGRGGETPPGREKTPVGETPRGYCRGGSPPDGS